MPRPKVDDGRNFSTFHFPCSDQGPASFGISNSHSHILFVRAGVSRLFLAERGDVCWGSLLYIVGSSSSAAITLAQAVDAMNYHEIFRLPHPSGVFRGPRQPCVNLLPPKVQAGDTRCQGACQVTAFRSTQELRSPQSSGQLVSETQILWRRLKTGLPRTPS